MPNKDSMKDIGWVGFGWAIITLIFGISFVLMWFDIDILKLIGVAVVIDDSKRMMFYFIVAAIGVVNFKHHESDRWVNFLIALLCLWQISGGGVGVKIDASEAARKAAEQFNEMSTNAAQHSYTPPAPAAQGKTDTRAYYNIFKRNSNSGRNYDHCMNLAMKGNWSAYKSAACNTGAPLTQQNIATCNSWAKSGALTTFQSNGCGFTKPAGLGTWCAMNVGQPGQQRAAICSG